jgi:macro domain protein
MFIYEDSNIFINKKLIINFPTKTHWKYPSQYSFIKDGLVSLKNEIISRNIQSIAIPALGCNNGGLDYDIVKEIIMKELGDLDCEIYLYESFNNEKTE